MADSDSGGSFIAGFLLGGIVGTLVGILLAPKPGSETRADLLVQSEALRERAEELAARVRERVGPAVEGVRERVGPAVEGVRERVAPVAERVTSRTGRRAAKPESDGGGPGSDLTTEATSAPEAEGQA